MKNVIIIGSGPAGYSAAIYAARANLKPLLISGSQIGGQLTTTTDVENYPGFATSVQGGDLVEQMRLQALHVGTEMLSDTVTSVDFSSMPFVLNCESGAVFQSKSVIISTGAQAKWLGNESEMAFRGFGVSGCATCDGFFYKKKPVAVIGGGNTAVEEAIYLTNFASKVYLVHRRDSLKAEKILQDRLFSNEKIEFCPNFELDEVLGETSPDRFVTGIRLKSTDGGASRDIKVDGIFIAIGHKPSTGFLKNSGIEMDGEGYVIVKPGTCDTNIEGVFAAGDVADKKYRQAVTAAGLGCMAALDALRFLEG